MSVESYGRLFPV